MELASVVLAWMISLQPYPSLQGGYAEVASGIADGCEAESLFGDKYKCAATMTSLAYFESTFRLSAIGDKGRSLGLFQVQTATAHLPAFFLTGEASTQTRVAIGLVLQSLHICRRSPLHERLAWYAAGGNGCSSHPDAVNKSRHRMALAAKLLRSVSLPPLSRGSANLDAASDLRVASP